METQTIVDIVILAYIAISVIIGAIRGLFKSIIGFATIGGSIALGGLISKWIAPKVTEWVYPMFSDKLVNAIVSKLGSAADVVSKEQLSALALPVIQPVIKAILWVIIGIILIIVLSIIGKVIGEAIEDAPGLKSANAYLGALLGLVTSLLVCYVLVFGIVKLGFKDWVVEKTGGSKVFNVISSCVPQSTEKFAIEIPGVGTIDFSEILKKDN